MGTTPSTLRGPWLSPLAALLSVVMPGAGHFAVGAKFRPAVVLAAALNLIAMIGLAIVFAHVGSTADVADVVAHREKFVLTAALLLVMAATRLWAALDASWRARPARAGRATTVLSGAAVVAVTIVGVAPMAVAADYVRRTDQAVERVFGGDGAVTANPGTIATTTTSSTVPPSTTAPRVSTTSTSSTSTTSTTIAPFAGLDRVNVLLLGGDAGPGRWSLRTDSMILVSVEPVTGDTAMISIPRNLTHLPFPPGTALAEKFPDGFTDLANAVYTYVDQHRELAGGGDDAGAQAIKQGVAQLLGVPVHHYVLVDMAGFVDIVDAIGGIDIDVPKRVPTAGNPRNAKHPVPKWIEVGPQHMDGTLALSYARSREADSDYNRMGRQRCVLASISEAATPKALATGLPALMDAFGGAVHTDIQRSQLGDFAQIVQRFTDNEGLLGVRTLHLAPPLVKPSNWDAAEVRALTAAALTPVPPPEFTGDLPILADACA